MNKEQVIKSGMLEQYAAGLLSAEEVQEMETYFERWPELRKHVVEMQDMLSEVGENYDLLDKNERPGAGRVVRMRDTRSVSSARKTSNWRSILLGTAFVGLLAALYFLYQNNHATSHELARANAQLERLQSDLDSNKNNLQQLLEKHNFFVHPHTARVHLQPLSPANFPGDAIAYYNPTAKQAFLKIVNIPPLSTERRYQIWADVEGQMVFMGKIEPRADEFVTIPFIPHAESLNITIEPATGSQQPTVEQLVMHGEIEL